MRRKPGNLSLKDCYDILQVPKNASLEDVKHSYRARAFELHPDLNPNDPNAGKNFQLLNEAYVALSAVLKAKEAKGTQDAQEKGAQKDSTKEKAQTNAEEKRREQADKAYAEQDVLRDLLNDPFAKRVFEDIYSELSKKQAEKQAAASKAKTSKEDVQDTQQESQPKEQKKPIYVTRTNTVQEKDKPKEVANEKGMGEFVKGWFKRQIDDELTVSLPLESLVPGKKIRLKIRHGLSNDSHTIDVTIPKNFVLGKPIRLKGLGKHVGPWQGDLYLILQGIRS